MSRGNSGETSLGPFICWDSLRAAGGGVGILFIYFRKKITMTSSWAPLPLEAVTRGCRSSSRTPSAHPSAPFPLPSRALRSIRRLDLRGGICWRWSRGSLLLRPLAVRSSDSVGRMAGGRGADVEIGWSAEPFLGEEIELLEAMDTEGGGKSVLWSA